MVSNAKQRTLGIWVAGFAIWTLLGLLSALQGISVNSRFAPDVKLDYTWIFTRSLWSWYSCALFTPAIFWVSRRFSLDQERRVRNLAIHFAAMIGFIVIKAFLYTEVAHQARLAPPTFTAKVEIVGDAFSLFLVYWTIVACAHAWDYYNRFRDRELRASRLETRLVQVQLDALRAQLHPHFLFNSLNALSTLIHKDPDAADQMVIRIGEMLRQSLDGSAPQEVTLRDELETMERYLAIMRVRLGDRLRVSVDVDAAALDAFVPNLLLQPLVENALRHGIGQRSDAGELDVSAHIENETLVIEVTDDGAGPAEHVREGVGMSNTRARLSQLYNSSSSLELLRAEGRGARSRVQLPYHTAPLLEQPA